MKKGFTLIELLIVIAIIGILSSIVIGSLTSARKRGKAAAVRSGMRELLTQGQLYLDDHGRFAAATTSARTGCYATSTATFLNDTIFGDPHPVDMVNEINKQGAPAFCSITADGSAFSLIALVENNRSLCLDSNGGRIESTTVTNQSGLCAIAQQGGGQSTSQLYISAAGIVSPSPVIVPVGGTILFSYTANSGEYRLRCTPQNIPVFTLDKENNARSITFNTAGAMTCIEDENNAGPAFTITVQ
jgi:prepilin-type N-terminal cleavage/methylation domain-containing protein